jgi:hypothetical protein
MVKKCKNCGEPIAEFPLFKMEGEKKVLVWKNLFKMSWDSIILILIITAMVIAYKHDTAVCMQIIKDPVDYCYKSNACKVLEEQQTHIGSARLPLLELPEE